MAWQAWYTLAVVIAVVVVLASERVSAPIAMMTAVAALVAPGVITTSQALSGFSNEAVITIAALYVVAGAVLATIFGVVQLWRSRRRAYRAFEVAVLLDLFLVQPFTLLDSGFAGLTHVFIDLILLASLRYAAHEER